MIRRLERRGRQSLGLGTVVDGVQVLASGRAPIVLAHDLLAAFLLERDQRSIAEVEPADVWDPHSRPVRARADVWYVHCLRSLALRGSRLQRASAMLAAACRLD